MAEEVEAEIEEEEEECPKCPPVGAPAWMATFADMATLLMAFFVLILSFAEFNVPKFKQISGSLKNAFGVQRLVPVVEQPKGTTVLSLNFSPSPSPSVTKQMTQQTTNLEKKELEVKTKEDEGGEKDKSAKELVEALQEAVDKGEIKVEAIGEAVKVEIGDQETLAKDLPKLIQETLEAIEEAKNKTGNTDQEVLFGGLEEKLKELASLAQIKADGETKGSSESSGSGVDDNDKSAKEDFLNHGTLIIGSQNKESIKIVKESHGVLPKKIISMDPTEAEMVKYFHNTFNALRVVFANEIFEICQNESIDYENVLMGALERNDYTDGYLKVNKDLRGYAGVCLPKDTKALAAYCKKNNLSLKLFENIEQSNEKLKKTVFKNMRKS